MCSRAIMYAASSLHIIYKSSLGQQEMRHLCVSPWMKCCIMAVQQSKGALNPNGNLYWCSAARRREGHLKENALDGRKDRMYLSETKKNKTSPEDSAI